MPFVIPAVPDPAMVVIDPPGFVTVSTLCALISTIIIESCNPNQSAESVGLDAVYSVVTAFEFKFTILIRLFPLSAIKSDDRSGEILMEEGVLNAGVMLSVLTTAEGEKLINLSRLEPLSVT